MEISRAELSSASTAAQAAGSPSSSAPQDLMGSEILIKSLQAEGVQ